VAARVGTSSLGGARDRGNGGSGNDRVFGGPQGDRVNCGGGRDVAFVNRADRVSRNCERVRVG
jgi:hypothetical protein